MATLSDDALTEPSDIKEIIDTDLDGDALNPFINAAVALMQDRDLAGQGMGTALLTEIEKWLAAHFVAIFDPRVKSESVGGEWQASYQIGKEGAGLKATVYGQQAIMLDTSGTLASVGQERAYLEVWSVYDND